MSKARKILRLCEQAECCNEAFNLDKAGKDLLKIEGSFNKAQKEFYKKYPDVKKMYADPSEEHPSYAEYTKMYDDYASNLLSLLKDNVSNFERESKDLLKNDDVVFVVKLIDGYLNVVNSFIKLKPYNTLLKDKERNDYLSLIKRYEQIYLDLFDYKNNAEDNFLKSYQDRYEGKLLKGAITYLRQDQFFGQNDLYRVVLKEVVGQEFPVFVDKEEAEKYNLEVGDKVSFKLKFHAGSSRGHDWNILVNHDLDAGILVFLDDLKK